MSVKLRLKRFGRLNHPTYRIVVADARAKRDGRIIETLGFYLPKLQREGEQFKLNTERVQYWLGVGAQASETVESLIKRVGVSMPIKKARKARKRKAKPFVPPPKAAPKKAKAKPADGAKKKD